MARAFADAIPLVGVPAGLEARPLVRLRAGDDGHFVEVRDRRGRRKTEMVALAAAAAAAEPDVVAAGLDETERRFLLGTQTRTWTTIVRRFEDAAWEKASVLARLGAVTIECTVDDRLRLGKPMRWRLTEPWQRYRSDVLSAEVDLKDSWRRRAASAADAVEGLCPELANALRGARAMRAAIPVLVCVAEDLAGGIRHDGARAFSQTHFGETKIRDDVAGVMRAAGIPGWVAEHLGVARSPHFGVGGPITLNAAGATVPLRNLDGPVLLRAGQPDVQIRLDQAAPVILVENLQAAESICDRWPDVAVGYTAGQPSEAALRVFAQMTAQASDVAIVPDADLGGVRIAERLLSVAPEARVIDVGTQPHARTKPWTEDATARAGLERALSGPAVDLAAACLARGYPVEQEAVIVGAAGDWLANLGH